MFLIKDYQINDCEIKNLLICLGKLVINNYPSIILEYNHKLSAKLKELMTTVINNLQICSQLESKISDLQIKLNIELEKKDKNEHLEFYKNSIELKKKKLKQLHIDNSHILAKIGSKFLKLRLLRNLEEFYNIYSKLDEFLDQGGCLKRKNISSYGRVVNRSSQSDLNFVNL
jgi:DNA polymerase III delta prime subunit